MKNCLKCKKKLDSNRKKFCDDFCKYWYNTVRKEKEAHLAPFKKRNKNFFSMIVGYHNSLKWSRQGKRNGSMVNGSMASIVNITTEEWAEVNYDNIKQHFTSIPFFRPSGIRLGDETWIKEENIERELNVRLDF